MVKKYLEKNMEARIPFKKKGQMQPCIGLYTAPVESIPKTELLEIPCRITATNRAANAPTYKTTLRRFNEGTPEQWIALLTALDEIWTQNQVTTASDRLALVRAVLREESLAQFEASLIVQQTTPTDNATNENAVEEEPLPLTIEFIDVALKEVAENVFPHRALEMQKLWMRRGLKKPTDMSFRALSSAVNRMNNALPYFPGATRESKLTEFDLIEVLEWAVPATWRAKFDWDNFVPTMHPREKLLKVCAAIERNTTEAPTAPPTKYGDRKEGPKKKGTHFGKSKHAPPVRKGAFFCSHHGHNNTHTSNDCFVLKNQPGGGGHGKDGKPLSTKKLFKKELHLLAKLPGAKLKALEAYSAIIEKEKNKLGKAKKALTKTKEAQSSDSDDESIHIMDVIPAPPSAKKKSKAKEPEEGWPERRKLDGPDTDTESTYLSRIAKEFNAKIKLGMQKKKLADYKKRLKKLGHENTDDEMSIISAGSSTIFSDDSKPNEALEDWEMANWYDSVVTSNQGRHTNDKIVIKNLYECYTTLATDKLDQEIHFLPREKSKKSDFRLSP